MFRECSWKFEQDWLWHKSQQTRSQLLSSQEYIAMRNFAAGVLSYVKVPLWVRMCGKRSAKKLLHQSLYRITSRKGGSSWKVISVSKRPSYLGFDVCWSKEKNVSIPWCSASNASYVYSLTTLAGSSFSRPITANCRPLRQKET